ncbi:MAG: hypothetical protein AAGC97_09680 [Planctomycetota bacterium]
MKMMSRIDVWNLHRTVGGVFAAVAIITCSHASKASSQDAILTEIYGRGVHAFHAGRFQDSYELLTLAIENGIKDPRAYYFRGFVSHASGRSIAAEADFDTGAEMEAEGGFGPVVGRALERIQGTVRLKLESIREKAKLQAMARGLQRSKTRRSELGIGDGSNVGSMNVQPPPTPAAENPFADELDEPMVEADDALEGVMDNPLAGDAPAPPGAAASGAANPFGSDAPAANDPFGAPPATDPFGAPSGDDPFGAPADDPFAAPGGGGMDDPFGSDPFGN